MSEIKEEIKNVLLMGLGAISLTGEKAEELKDELLEKGKSLYKEGMIKNEELKRDLKDKIKENVTVEVTTQTPATKEDIIDAIKDMSDEEKEEAKTEKKEVKAEKKENKKEDK